MHNFRATCGIPWTSVSSEQCIQGVVIKLVQLLQAHSGLHPSMQGTNQFDASLAAQALQAGSRLHYEFYEEHGGNETAGGVRVINLKRVDKYAESEHEILFQLVKQFNVPEKLRYASQRP